MATLVSLKRAIREKDASASPLLKHALSDAQYSAGFDLLTRGPGRGTYNQFIIPSLSELLSPLFDSRVHISVLEIGPGPETVLGRLPERLRRKIRKYSAFEPNRLFAARLEESLSSISGAQSQLPCLDSPPSIHRTQFAVSAGEADGEEKFNVILFCHSMYGMKPKHAFVRKALKRLVEKPEDGLVVVFHREALYLDGLVCYRTTSFPTGIVGVTDDNENLNCFASFVAGSSSSDESVRAARRDVCRALAGREITHQGHLVFRAPEILVAFNKYATALPLLIAEVPLNTDMMVKNSKARLHRPAAIVRPSNLRDIQECVRWALRHSVGLSIVGGGYSGHCLWPNVVAVDMGAFNQVHVLAAEDNCISSPLIVAEAGCKTGDIVHKAMRSGLAVPLGARPSVGAGLWLQGGIGHLARQHGLTCDAIVGAVVISVDSAQVLTVGYVPLQHRPAGSSLQTQPDLLWALQGAGTNFGIVVSVTFKAYAAPAYLVRNCFHPLNDRLEARQKLIEFDKTVAKSPDRNCSADAYLYWSDGRLRLAVTKFEVSAAETDSPLTGRETLASVTTTDGVGVFDTELYMSGMHRGHGGGKTSSFKRCLFLKDIAAANIADILIAAVESRPTPLCYLHLLQGGGAIADVGSDSTAFGCRDWDFACVVTGVWARDLDGSQTAEAAVDWVYKVVRELLPVSSGAYGADLGPDPRDAMLIATAFGQNLPRLARLKQDADPRNVLAYSCPLPQTPMGPRLIILVTGENGVGKDHSAEIWVSVFTSHGFKARAVSISETTKREYAKVTGTDLNRLLHDRTYKEQHRVSLTSFFRDQVKQRPRLPEEHFLRVVYDAACLDVLFITGMRDEAPVAALSHLVSHSKLLEVRVAICEQTRELRQLLTGERDACRDKGAGTCGDLSQRRPQSNALGYRPSFVFNNDRTGDRPAENFASEHLLPLLHEDLQRLAGMVRPVPNFPRLGIEFRHVLDIAQQPGGLALCISLLQSHFVGDWTEIDAVACCEAGGFVFASALASRINLPLALIRKAGKLPPPTVSVAKALSHISVSSALGDTGERIEMDEFVIRKGASVLVVEDVLATGETLCAMLRLLGAVGVDAERISVLVVAEFPLHRGREVLRQEGFSRVTVQSLLVFSGA